METVTGRCLCGAVELGAKPKFSSMGACHCSMCRKWSGGPLLAVDCGTDVSISGKEYVSVYNSSEWAERCFCSRCGTHLFYRLKAMGKYIVPVGLFDAEAEVNFHHQIFIDEKPSYYDFANQTENMSGQEMLDKFSGVD